MVQVLEIRRWGGLEIAADLLEAVEVPMGTRMTVQGRPSSRVWLISAGEALVSADARPLRVIGPGEAGGVAAMLYSIASPETTIALTSVRAFVAGLPEFTELLCDDRIRRRLLVLAGDELRSRQAAKPR